MVESLHFWELEPESEPEPTIEKPGAGQKQTGSATLGAVHPCAGMTDIVSYRTFCECKSKFKTMTVFFSFGLLSFNNPGF